MKIKLAVLTFLCCFILNAQTTKQPNILWIVCEDISPTLSMYGDHNAKTPNLDKLAQKSIVYTNAFATTGVCAPSRSAIITGMLPSSIGTMHMRTAKDVMSWGKRSYKEVATRGEENPEPVLDLKGNTIREYSAVVPDGIKCFTEYLRASGYYCTNNQKTDYQFAAPISAWDENDPKAHWRNRPEGKPFFSVFNLGDTHESRIWLNKDLPLTVDPTKVFLPPYFPDNAVVRNDVARHYSNIEIMDKNAGIIIDQLIKDGLYDDTIIFFYSDHGGPLPRQKREIYESGLKAPLFIKLPNSQTFSKNDRLISFTDLGPTVLSLANVKPPKGIEGRPFLGKYECKSREFVFGTSDRFDEFSDRIRSVRTEKYLYIKNYHPELPKYKDVGYRKSMPMMMNMLTLKEANQLDQYQLSWFQSKVTEELYDIINDPYSMTNLAENPAYQKVLNQLRKQEIKKFEKDYDFGSLPEADMIAKMWPNNTQPITAKPSYSIKNGVLTASCATKSASISYKMSKSKDEKFDVSSKWTLYTQPIPIPKGHYVYIIANRIGFQDSAIVMAK
ncbi:sulfatase [Flavobacterium sp. NG2]|uniref:sulfatase family protein n=1 Tax=Flavobacterium sp. NG2 TaxID=3097547 RepID=UPI002A830AE9|nr:sulfatase [Flavobacterium sp. NG2]WPR71964.1 sulfatase [Flavobacterium sp. NG2]